MNQTFIITKTNDIDYLQFNKLLEFDELVHAFSLKSHNIGFRQGGKNFTADLSYNRICNALNIDEKVIIHPDQKHTDNICEYRDEEKMSLAKVDGIITDKKQKATLLTFSDCTPLLFYDPKEKVLANIHSGWRGTIQQIASKTVDKMVKDYNCKTENIICCIGPTIRKDHFLVNTDVTEIFQNAFKELCNKYNIIENTDFENEKGKQYMIDTVLVNKIILKNQGLLDKNIIDSEICTVCQKDLFHSRRAEGEKYQANGCLMMLK